MLTAKYYEKNNGYKYVLDTLKEQLGEKTTVSIVDEAVKKCNTLCREYAGFYAFFVSQGILQDALCFF